MLGIYLMYIFLSFFTQNSFEATSLFPEFFPENVEISAEFCETFNGTVSPNSRSCSFPMEMSASCYFCVFEGLFPEFSVMQNSYGPDAPDNSGCKDIVETITKMTVNTVEEVTGSDCYFSGCYYDEVDPSTTTRRCVDKSQYAEYLYSNGPYFPPEYTNPQRMCACAPVTAFTEEIMYVGPTQVLPLRTTLDAIVQAGLIGVYYFDYVPMGLVETPFYSYLVGDYTPFHCNKVACYLDFFNPGLEPTLFDKEYVSSGIYGLKVQGKSQYLCAIYSKFRLCSKKSKMANFLEANDAKRSSASFVETAFQRKQSGNSFFSYNRL